MHHEKLVTMLKDVFGDKLCPVVFAQEVLWMINQLLIKEKYEIGLSSVCVCVCVFSGIQKS